MKEKANQGVFWAFFVYFSQIPLLILYARGKIPIHPIVVMLPLLGLLNTKIEMRGAEGLGLWQVKADRTLFLALIYGAFSITGGLIVLILGGGVLRIPSLTTQTFWTLLQSFLVSVFILALWEEILNRGYIQTRLQVVWGFNGVFVSSFLFASVHIPSTLLDYDNDITKALLRFIETGLAGFTLGYVYWLTRSVVTTIAIHGLNNFLTTVMLPLFSGVTTEQLLYRQPLFTLIWLCIQVGLILILCHIIYKRVDYLHCVIRANHKKDNIRENA